MTDAFAESASLSDEVRADIGRGHQELYATLGDDPRRRRRRC